MDMSTANLQLVGLNQLPKIYAHIQEDFSSQYAPYRIYAEYLAEQKLHCYQLSLGKQMLGYALTFVHPELPLQIIWHLAVLREHRERGYGSQLLKLLSQELVDSQGILVEVERVQNAASLAEQKERQRRITFYERAGYRIMPHHWTLHGTAYKLMFGNNDSLQDHFTTILEQADSIYRSFYPPMVPVVYFEAD